MHVGQGLVTHGTKEMVSMCNAQDEKGPFWKSVVNCHEDAKVKVTALKSSPEYKQLHKESTHYRKKEVKLIDDADKAKEEATPEESSTIQQTCANQTKHMKKECLKHAKESRHGQITQQIKGYNKMIELLEKHVNGKTKKPCGPIAWSFLTSVEHDAGGNFLP